MFNEALRRLSPMSDSRGFSRSVLGLTSMLALGVSSVMFLGGCAPPAQQQTTADLPPYAELRVLEIDQLSKLDTKTADGQFVVTKLSFKNISKEDLGFNSTDLKIRYMPEDSDVKDQYSQGIEPGLKPDFGKAYPADAKDKMLDPGLRTNVHPNLTVERYALFLLPTEARLDDYKVIYTPPAAAASPFGASGPVKPPLEVPLKDENTQVNDKREIL